MQGTAYPPGKWYFIAIQSLEASGADVARSTALLYVLGNALRDAAIGAWYAKDIFTSVRPITAIQCLNQGNQVSSMPGQTLHKHTVKASAPPCTALLVSVNKRSAVRACS